MNIQAIPYLNLLIAFIPVALVVVLLFKWTAVGPNTLYAFSRMFVQLLLIGYFLTFLFESDNAWVVQLVLLVMLCTASWIALRTVESAERRSLFIKSLLSIIIGGGFTLLLITQAVLRLDPWYMPRYMIPLAGMIFASSMNSVSLAAERLYAEMQRDVPYIKAREIALRASLIPITNSLFAVGLVSIPGMMTGQILSGIAPPVAARYQIMVMCMIFSSSGISAACFLHLLKPKD